MKYFKIISFCFFCVFGFSDYRIGSINLSESQLISLVELKENEIFTPGKASNTIRNLYRTGFFSDVKISTDFLNETTVNIDIECIRKELFGPLELSGDIPVKKRKVKKFIREHYLENKDFTMDRYYTFIEGLSSFFVEYGYPDVNIEHYLDFPEGTSTVIPVIRIIPGKPIIIGTIRFNDPIVKKFLKLKAGDVFNEKQFQHDLDEIREFLKQEKYLKNSILVDKNIQDKITDINIRIIRGPQYELVTENMGEIPHEDIEDACIFFKSGEITETSLNISQRNIYFLALENGYFEPDILLSIKNNHILCRLNNPEKKEVKEIQLVSDAELQLPKVDFFNTVSKNVVFNSISEQCKQKGYLSPRVQFDYAEPTKTMTVNIQKGNKLVFGPVQITKNFDSDLSVPDILTEGLPFSTDSIAKALYQIKQQAASSSFYNVDVIVRKGESADNSIPLNIIVQAEPEKIIRSIYVDGLHNIQRKYIDKVIGKQVGDAIHYSDIIRIINRLENSGYFSEVQVEPFFSAENEVILFLKLKETNLYSFIYSIGANSDEGIRFSASVIKNYIFNLERTAKFSARISDKRSQVYFNVSGRDRFMGTLFYFRDDKSDYLFDKYGINISYNAFFKKELRGVATLQYKHSRLDNLTVPVEDIEKEFHPAKIVSLITKVLYDRRDDIIFPEKGYYISLLAEPAYDLTQSNYYIKALEKSAFYFKRFSVSQTLGYIWADSSYTVPLSERFFTGGQNSLRISSFEKAGPQFSNGAPMGGNFLALFNFEYSFPINNTLNGIVFLDIGNVWNDISDASLDTAFKDVGLGVWARTPLGPVKIELAFNLDKDVTPTGTKIIFSVGHTF